MNQVGEIHEESGNTVSCEGSGKRSAKSQLDNWQTSNKICTHRYSEV